ncbi:MAG: energy transducer TonB [Janthinobacterium lividum]
MSARYTWVIVVAALGLPGLAAAQGASRASLSTVVAPAVGPGGGSSKAAPVAAQAFSPDSIFINPDVRPQFTGGEPALLAYMTKNMHYPEMARMKKVTGKVYIRFVLSAAGRITDASLVRGPGSGLNEEALRLVWLMPPWKPGYQRGQAVRVVCTMPIEFQL